VSSLDGHLAETFSVGPLAAVAAVLLTRRMPPLFGEGPGGDLLPATGAEAAGDPIAVLCTDYVGLVSGCVVSPARK
jgi:hypothetical protein